MATKEAQAEYQRKWMAARRKAWFDENGPCVDCGSSDRLELDHVVASTKVSHAVWSWSAMRRDVELAKCVVRCVPCHDRKTLAQGEYSRGSAHGRSKLTEEQVRLLRVAYLQGQNVAEIARQFNISRDTANKAARGITWKHVIGV